MLELADGLAVLGGGAVGFVLGLVGGGGSILAVPLLLYGVGVASPHVAIGTGALAVAVNAFANLVPHARAGTVKWPCAAVFAAAGVAGAWVGARLGQAVDGQRLMLLFAGIMLVVAAAMLLPRRNAGDAAVRITPAIGLRLGGYGAGTGLLAGFFGIGGGFLIVPGLIAGSGMPILNAVGSSLVSVGVFGLTTAISYATVGLVDWAVAAKFVAGGIAGGWLGMRAAVALAARRNLLSRLFAALVAAVAVFVAWRSLAG